MDGETQRRRGRPPPRLVWVTTRLLLLTALIPLLVAGVLSISWQRITITERATEDLEQLADVQRDRVLLVSTGPMTAARMVSSRTQLRIDLAAVLGGVDVDDTLIARILADARDGDPTILSITVTDPSGLPLASTGDVDVEPLAIVDTLDLSGTDGSATLLSRDGDRVTWEVAVPMPVEDDIVGAMVLVVDPTALQEVVATRSGSTGARARTCLYVSDTSGNAVSVLGDADDNCGADAVDASGVIPATLDDAPAIRAIRGEAGTWLDTTLATGAPVVAVTRPLPEYGWGLVVRTSQSELLAPVRGASWALAGLLAMVGAVAILLAVLVADRLGRPLLGLQAAAHRIEQGDLDAALDAELRRGPAEIRDLGARFAGMAAALASHRQEQEERYRDLEVLTHAMVHDLKGPLTAAAGLLQLVDRDRVADEEERRLLIHRSLAATGRMQRLIDDLLALLRAIGGPIGNEAVPLGPLVEEAVCSLELTGLVDHEELPVVVGDRLLLEQMVQNLLHNAATYHRPGCPARIVVSSDPMTGDMVTLHVDDDGIGIPPKDRTRILQTFARGSNVVDGGGTGLGLPITVRVIERHGGSLSLGDSPLGGTRVSVTLPAVAAQSDTAVV